MFSATILAIALCGQTYRGTASFVDNMQFQANEQARLNGIEPLPPPPVPVKPLSRAKRVAAIRAQQPVAMKPDPVNLALSRLNTAKQLIKAGRRDQAKGWLDQVIAMNASPATVAEARKLLK